MSSSRLLFNVALGLTDGILTALILTAGALLRGTTDLQIDQALRVSVAAGLSALFTVFVSDYARLRGELSHSARELNLASVRPLLGSRLSAKVRAQAVIAAVTTTACSFLGSMIPLASAAAWQVAWAAFPAAAIALVLIGFILGHLVGGRSLVWAFLLLLGGAAIALAGIWLNVVG
jgi:predicted membrane protein (TIGR00267 family)